ncbi:MAG: hypothetical protein ABJD51_02070 [Roseobacter sp.]
MPNLKNITFLLERLIEADDPALKEDLLRDLRAAGAGQVLTDVLGDELPELLSPSPPQSDQAGLSVEKLN